MSTNVAPAPAPAAAPAAPAGRRRAPRIALGIALFAALVAGGVFALVHFGGGHKDGSLSGAAKGSPFTIARPQGWQTTPAAKLATLKGRPLAVLRRADGKALLVVNSRAKAPKTLRGITTQLDRQLSARLSDFKRISSRTVKVRAGDAFLYSYVRRSKGTVNTVVIVPVKDRTYVVNAIVSTGARKTARQVGAMIASFNA
jgi:hypothetical protein